MKTASYGFMEQSNWKVNKMAVKSTMLKVGATQESKYPALMCSTTNTQLVVLMSRYGYGTVVHPSSFHTVGTILDDWLMDRFKPFTGTITLKGE